MSILEDVGRYAGSALGGVLGTIVAPGVGSVAGAALGGAIGDFLGGKAGDFIDGDDAPAAKSAATPTGALPSYAPGSVLPPGFPGVPQDGAQSFGFGGGASGGGGAGSSFAPPSVPAQPGGGLAGPVYSTQSGGLIPAAASALSTVMSLLQTYPMISQYLQRRWDFPTESVVQVPKSPALWRALAQQIPKANREALEQFLVGFPAPVGLSKAASDTFLTLMIAEAGYSPEEIGCCYMATGGK